MIVRCKLCNLLIRTQGTRCPECRSRANHVTPQERLKEPCFMCGIAGPWLMEEHDKKIICGNCHRAIHRSRSASLKFRRQHQIDIYKSAKSCSDCAEQHPDKLVFVKNDKIIYPSAHIAKARLVRLIKGAEVLCVNCYRTRRRNSVRV